MFFKQLLEDFDYETLVDVYENDKYFMFLRSRYALTDLEKGLFEALKSADVPMRRNSLEVLALRKDGVLPRVIVIDQEDEFIRVKDMSRVTLLELAGMPVDLVLTSDEMRSIRFIIVFLLEYTYYRAEEEKERSRNDITRLGGLDMRLELE